MKTKTNFLAALFTLITVAMVFAQKPANGSPAVPKAREFYTVMILHEKTAKYEIDVQYPLFNNQAADPAIEEYIREEMQAFREYANEYAQPDMPHSFDIGFDVSRFTDTIVSIVLSESQFTGGAHGSEFYKTFTVDLANSERIGFDEMFTDKAAALKVIAEIVKREITENMGENADSIYEDALSPQVSVFETFKLTSYGITFLFAADVIAPHALGVHQATVYFNDEKLKPLLKKPFRNVE